MSREEEIKSLINEAVLKFVNGIIGIENLFDTTLNDVDWKIVSKDITYQIYLEKFKTGDQK